MELISCRAKVLLQVCCLVMLMGFTSSAGAQENRPESEHSRGARGPAPIVELTANQGAFSFNGNDTFLDLGNSPILRLSPKDFTVAAWVKFKSLTVGGPPCLGPGCDMSIVDKMLSSTVSGPNINGWRLLKQSDDTFWFCLGAPSNGCVNGVSTTVVSQTAVVPNIWYYVTGVKTSNTLSIYVNGLFEATTVLGDFVDTNLVNLLVGRNAGEGAFLNGKIDNVALFNKALGQRQIKTLYDLSKREHKN